MLGETAQEKMQGFAQEVKGFAQGIDPDRLRVACVLAAAAPTIAMRVKHRTGGAMRACGNPFATIAHGDGSETRA